jgi:hypothetical protein
MTSEELAYIAGIFDGEECVGIYKVRDHHPYPSSHYVLHVQVGTTELDMVDWLHREFGGCLVFHRSKKLRERDAWHWHLVSNVAARFLEQILPYLRLKKRQAGVALEFQRNQNPGYNLSPEEWGLRDAQAAELRRLKKLQEVRR